MCHKTAPQGTHAKSLSSSLPCIGTLDRSFTLALCLFGDYARALTWAGKVRQTRNGQKKKERAVGLIYFWRDLSSVDLLWNVKSFTRGMELP